MGQHLFFYWNSSQGWSIQREGSSTLPLSSNSRDYPKFWVVSYFASGAIVLCWFGHMFRVINFLKGLLKIRFQFRCRVHQRVHVAFYQGFQGVWIRNRPTPSHHLHCPWQLSIPLTLFEFILTLILLFSQSISITWQKGKFLLRSLQNMKQKSTWYLSEANVQSISWVRKITNQHAFSLVFFYQLCSVFLKHFVMFICERYYINKCTY